MGLHERLDMPYCNLTQNLEKLGFWGVTSTNSSRSYSGLVDTWVDTCLHPPAHTVGLFKGFPYKCRWLAYGSFQLMHISCDDHAVPVEQAMAGSQKGDNKLLQCSQLRLRGEFQYNYKCHCITVITAVYSESSWAFPESCTANESQTGTRQAMAVDWKTKALITPPLRWFQH